MKLHTLSQDEQKKMFILKIVQPLKEFFEIKDTFFK